jgi:hypothetical protein
MMQCPRFQFTLSLLVLFAALAGFGNSINPTAFAANPPATGTIYYRTGTVFYAVKADGTGKSSDVLPNISLLSWPVYGNANPAGHPSGDNPIHDRWWIYPAKTGVYDNYVYPNGTVSHSIGHYDLFAVRSNPQDRSQLVTVQLTDLYGIVSFEGAAACWSNDSNEDFSTSFVAGWAQDLRDAFAENPDGTTTINAAQRISHTMRLPFTASAINAGWQSSSFVPIGTDSVTEAELDSMLSPSMAGTRIDGQGVISPDGSFYVGNNSSESQLVLRDAAQPASTAPIAILWDGAAGAPNVMSGGQWSPNGLTIAVSDSNGNIWTQPASAATPPKKILSSITKGSTMTAYSSPIWSPDSKYLVVLKQQFSGSTVTGAWLTRLSVADGKTLDLVPASTTAGSFNVPLRWVADN